MADSDDENLLYAPTGRDLHHQGKGLLGNGVKNVNDILNGPTDNRKLKKTIALCGAFLGLGLAVAVLGPTLQDLKHHLNTDLPHVSYIFTGRSIGYVFGSIIGGVTFERFHPLLLIAVTLAMSGLGLLITPYCHHLMASVLAISFVGIAMGALDTGANIVCLRMWGKKSAPFMQALHFSFALGAFIAPLLAGPFIGPLGQFSNSTPGISTTSSSVLSNSTTPKSLTSSSLKPTNSVKSEPPNFSEAKINFSTPEPTDLSSPESTTFSEYEMLNFSSPESTTDLGPTPTDFISPAHTHSSMPASTNSSETELTSSSEDEFLNSTTLAPTNSSTPASTNSSTPAPTNSSTPASTNSSTPAPTNSSTPTSTNSSTRASTNSSTPASTNSSTPASTISSETELPSSSKGEPSRKKRESYWSSRRLLEKFERNDYTRFHAEEDVSKRKWANKHWRSRIILGEAATVKNAVATSLSSVKTTVITATDGPDSRKLSTAKHFQGVYVIIAVFLMLMAIVFTYFFCTSPLQHPQASGHSEKVNMQSMKPSDKNFTNYILGLLFLFYFLYVGAEVGYGGFIFTFATNKTDPFSPKEATHLNSLFWGTFALGRGLSICIASVISPFNMLLIDIAGCIVSSLALAYEANTNTIVLWVGTATLGASMASLFPAGISWLESHAPVTGNMASLLIVGAALGEMVIPLLLGNLFNSHIGPMSLMYVMLITSILTAIIFGITVYAATSEGKSYDPLPKEDFLEDIITGVQSAIDTTDVPLQLNGSTKQTSKPFLPKPLQAKKHKE